MAAGPVEELKRALRCPVCHQTLEDARVLKCGHTFCFLCIKRDYERHQLNKGNCPVCDENYFVRERDPQHLPKAFVVNDVLEIVRSPRLCTCAFCQADDGGNVCLKCKLYMCRYCSKRKNSFCEHQLVSTDYLNSDPFLREVVQRSKSKQTCQSHPDEDVSFFCYDCKHGMCDECKNEVHRYHDMLRLQEAVARVTEKDFPRKLEEKRQELDRMLRLTIERNEDPSKPKDRQFCRFYRDECSILKKQMHDMLKYGSEQVTLEMFHERKTRVEKALDYKSFRKDSRPTLKSLQTLTNKDIREKFVSFSLLLPGKGNESDNDDLYS
ncbi:E3 ubiquitin-protein ligase Midline-1-like [Argopecten irradians]|uniref:E3 ubiquitin-protein ligase Midline-1-like n=1 Tax=Argopecten irradians TaxID=31199 RepID=UPI0037101F8C